MLAKIDGAGVNDAVERTTSPARPMFEAAGQLVEEQEGGRPCMRVSHTLKTHPFP